MGFKDHFSSHSADYAAFRPTYPDALVEFLADHAPATGLALDVGCGSGQLSVLLPRRFTRVVATDASGAQLANAKPHPAVEYRHAPAERTGLADASADLVVAAQAAHWFDLPAFFDEARRVLRPGGLLALVSYATLEADPEVQPVIEAFYRGPLDPHWPPERRIVESGYRTLAFPFDELAPPPVAIEVAWPLAPLLGYVRTWSAVRALEKAGEGAAWERFVDELAEAWGDPARVRRFSFPLAVRAGLRR